MLKVGDYVNGHLGTLLPYGLQPRSLLWEFENTSIRSMQLPIFGWGKSIALFDASPKTAHLAITLYRRYVRLQYATRYDEHRQEFEEA